MMFGALYYLLFALIAVLLLSAKEGLSQRPEFPIRGDWRGLQRTAINRPLW